MVVRRFKVFNAFLVLCSLSITLLVYLIIRSAFPGEIDRKEILRQIQLSLHAAKNDSLLCKSPDLPVFSPEIMKFIHTVPPIDCKSAGPNWVKCENTVCVIQDEVKSLYGDIKCEFTDVIRIDDEQNTDGKTTVSNDDYKLIGSDVVKVACTSAKKEWSTVLMSARKNISTWEQSSWEKVPANAFQMNVLMFGVDSVSRNLFIRKLPKTYKFLTKQLDGIVLEGYNIVGDGTPQALIPILTGQTELELPDTRKRFENSEYVNSYPLIWDDFKNAGYVTAFLEDLPLYGTFTYRLRGFKEPPTDHYLRPYYLSEIPEYKKWSRFCTAGTPRHKIMTNYITDFFKVYKDKPKYLFGFHGELSHDDYNLVGAADGDFESFLKDLNNSGALNNTVFMFFADHGHRFAKIRNTLQGKQEERLPFFSITLPKWFKSKYPERYQALKKNVKRLSTPFDIHATLKTVLDPSYTGDKTNRSLSLFSEIPMERTCSKAFIEPHWCACLAWHPIDTSEPIVSHLSKILLQTLNDYTSQYRNLCVMWTLEKINWASKLLPNDNLVKFKQNADRDGFLGDFTGDTDIITETFQISVQLNPSAALFEGSITHNLKTNKYNLKISDISRINMYRNQAVCIEERYPHLRKYCHCKID